MGDGSPAGAAAARDAATPPRATRVCRGPLLSRAQYLIDIEQWGYADARLGPNGFMSDDEVAHWTAAIEAKRTDAELRC